MEKEHIPHIPISNINEWRTWLKKNHMKEKKVGLVVYKKQSGKPILTHKELMEEAICFGWIDITIKRLDNEKFIRYFVKRGENANWSKNTLKYGKQLFTSGKMSSHGILRYQQGLKKKPHDHGIPDNPNMPKDLKSELEKNKHAYTNFLAFPNSIKKMYFRWILRARTKVTRIRRIISVVENAKMNIRALYAV